MRRLDLAVETERRTALDQIPLRQIEEVAREISTYLRRAFENFIGSESPSLMAIAVQGDFKFVAIERFKGLLHSTVKASFRTNSPIPPWAADRVREAWNV